MKRILSNLQYSSLEPYFCQHFTFIDLGYKFCYPWISRAFLEALSSKCRNKKSLKIGDRAQKPDRAQHPAPRDFKTKERESEGREVILGTLLKLSVKERQAALQWKSTHEPLRANNSRNESSTIQHLVEQGDEDFCTGLPHMISRKNII